MQDMTGVVNRALTASGFAKMLNPVQSNEVPRDEGLLPWELGDIEERMERVREQTNAHE